MSPLDLIFLGTGGAWPIPELGCDCRICREMRRKKEQRKRTALLLRGQGTLLIDCGPDIASQLAEYNPGKPDGVLITHEHGDHYLGLDALSSYKRSCPRDRYVPIPVFITPKSLEVVGAHFGYLEQSGVIRFRLIEPGRPFSFMDFHLLAFKTNHGGFAPGSVGYVIECPGTKGEVVRLVYTSDLVDLPVSPRALFDPDYLIIQSFWFNEPRENRANHLSFQRAVDYIRQWNPRKETFLVHIGDGDAVPGDPANAMAKKIEPADPLSSPSSGTPYPVPLNQEQWQEGVNRVMTEHKLPFKVTVAYDHLCVSL
ncbi:MAG: MBL fold metallo-hydrolase [Desulfatiglandales bacterium]